jgi:enediyne biosynthesis protein E4
VSDSHVHRAVTTQKSYPPGVGDTYNDWRVNVVVRITGKGLMIPHNIDCSKHRVGLNRTGLAVGVRITRLANGVEPGIFERCGGSYLCFSTTRCVLGLRAAEYADWIQVPWPVSVGRTERYEHVHAGKHYPLASGGNIL